MSSSDLDSGAPSTSTTVPPVEPANWQLALAYLRKINWTHQQIADAIGASPKSVSRWENSRNPPLGCFCTNLINAALHQSGKRHPRDLLKELNVESYADGVIRI